MTFRFRRDDISIGVKSPPSQWLRSVKDCEILSVNCFEPEKMWSIRFPSIFEYLAISKPLRTQTSTVIIDPEAADSLRWKHQNGHLFETNCESSETERLFIRARQAISQHSIAEKSFEKRIKSECCELKRNKLFSHLPAMSVIKLEFCENLLNLQFILHNLEIDCII